MKKFLSILLFIAFFTCSIFTVSAENAGEVEKTPTPPDYPLVLVRGMDFDGLYFDYGTENESPAIKDITAIEITKLLGNALVGTLQAKSLDGILPPVLEFVDYMLGSIACDNEGNSVYDLSSGRYPLSLDNYPEFVEYLLDGAGGSEYGILHSAIENYGAEYVYYLNYDWRLDPRDTADALDALIKQAKADHSTDKVNIVACSMGGVIMNSYFYEYGNENINKCIFLSSTFQGAYITTDLFQGRVNISPDALYYFLKDSYDSFFIDILHKTGLLKIAANFANSFVERNKELAYDTILRGTLGTIPTYWALVQPEELDACIEYMFPSDELKDEYSVFIEKVRGISEIMSESADLLTELPLNDTAVAVVASYNHAIIPVYASATTHGDGTLESAFMFGGATVADMGKTLGDDYIAADPLKVSPDNIVDLSDVLFPESTWALKNAPHVGCSYGTDMSEFLFWLLGFDGQPTVNSNERYPQFMISDNDKSLTLF